jgi:predicted transcriptional regulator
VPASRPPDGFQPNLYVVARFLDALARPGPAPSRTQLQLAVGVNYDILRRYVEFLERKGYAAVDAGKVETVRLTPQGHALRAELVTWIARFLGEGTLAERER